MNASELLHFNASGITGRAYVSGKMQNIPVVELDGDVAGEAIDSLVDFFDSLIHRAGTRYIIDLSSVKRIDMDGWEFFLGSLKILRREGGGYVITGMNSDIRTSFEELELNAVIPSFATIDDAAKGQWNTVTEQEDAFDKIEAAKSGSDSDEACSEARNVEASSFTGNCKDASPGDEEEGGGKEERGESYTEESTESSLLEKVKMIIVDNPDISTPGIWRQLRNERYGNEKIGLIKLHRILCILNLDTKQKRYRFYRSL
jgi:anti-anti-sigma regulatory factor